MPEKNVFVTVGTTQFPKLIECVSSPQILDVLSEKGFTCVQFQVGNTQSFVEAKHDKINLKYDKYFENFEEQIVKSDLVISHAGAGTCLEVLRKKKPLVVVVNEDLMGNHQTELAEQLAQEGYLKCCVPSTLGQVLVTFDGINDFKTYPEPDCNLFSRYLDRCMGFQ